MLSVDISIVRDTINLDIKRPHLYIHITSCSNMKELFSSLRQNSGGNSRYINYSVTSCTNLAHSNYATELVANVIFTSVLRFRE